MVHTLVPSDRVEAAAVYGRDGQKIGTIERLMLEKKAGTVAYAVVQCGGFLKGDTHHYPLPWSSLKYNVARNAYETGLTLEELRSGRSELDGEAFDWGDRSPVYQYRYYWTVLSERLSADHLNVHHSAVGRLAIDASSRGANANLAAAYALVGKMEEAKWTTCTT